MTEEAKYIAKIKRLAWEFAEHTQRNSLRPMTKKDWFDHYYPLLLRDIREIENPTQQRPEGEPESPEQLAREAARFLCQDYHFIRKDLEVQTVNLLEPFFRRVNQGNGEIPVTLECTEERRITPKVYILGQLAAAWVAVLSERDRKPERLIPEANRLAERQTESLLADTAEEDPEASIEIEMKYPRTPR
jgi:hypothetical protein